MHALRLVTSLAVAACAAAPVFAADTLVQFSGGIGVDPIAGLNAGLPVVNTVLGVPPGGRPWVIRKLRASVFVDGTVSIRGSGLLISGGDAIGTRGPVAQVSATLFCGGIPYDTAAADLDTAGNFQIGGPLSAVPPVPCSAPVLLVRNAAGARPWFAAGIPGGDD